MTPNPSADIERRLENLWYQRKFEEEQKQATMLAGPVYTHYEHGHAPAPSSLDSLADLPQRPRRLNGKIAPPDPEPAEVPVKQAPAAPGPDIGTIARQLGQLAEQVNEMAEVLHLVCRQTGVKRG